MIIAIAVKDESLTLFGNAGHTPKFAIYEMSGSGMFKSFKLKEIRDNPRTDLDHDEDEHHQCGHDANDQEHINQHNKMGVALDGCNYIVVQKACKNTANSMKAKGISIVKYAGDATKADAVLREIASKFI